VQQKKCGDCFANFPPKSGDELMIEASRVSGPVKVKIHD
jgi:hypothetical protein